MVVGLVLAVALLLVVPDAGADGIAALYPGGEHAMWLDGVKVSHLGQGFPNGHWSGGIFTQDPSGSPFEGFRWRSDSNLNLNWIWLQNYSPDDPPGVRQDMKFDHVVVARSYIGCLASGSTIPVAPTGLDVR